MSPNSFPPDLPLQIVFDPGSELQSDAASAFAAQHPAAVLLGADLERSLADGELICFDADLLHRIPAERRAKTWYAPLAWHHDAVEISGEMPRRVLVLHESLRGLFPRAESQLIAYPLAVDGIHRVDRVSVRQRLGISPGRLAVFCREESSPLMRVMKALENDERITVMTTEDSDHSDGNRAHRAECALLAACDLFVAESSARTVAESLTYGVPMAAMVREGGDVNARFLSESGAGVVAGRPGEMLMLIDDLVSSFPASLREIRGQLELLRKGLSMVAPAGRIAAVGTSAAYSARPMTKSFFATDQ